MIDKVNILSNVIGTYRGHRKGVRHIFRPSYYGWSYDTRFDAGPSRRCLNQHNIFGLVVVLCLILLKNPSQSL